MSYRLTPYAQQEGVRATSMITLTDKFTMFGIGLNERYGAVPPEFLAAGLGAMLARLPIDNNETLVIIDGTLPVQLGMPNEWTAASEPIRMHPILDSLVKHGWDVRELRPWTRMTREHQTLTVCWRPLVEQMGGCPLFANSAQQTATNFMMWHACTRVPWWGNGGVVGQQMMRQPHLHQAPAGESNRISWYLNEKGKPQEPAEWFGAATPYNPKQWSTEQPGRFLYKVDQRFAYLGAWQSALLPAKRLRRGPREFDPKAAGLWLVETPEWTQADLPDPAGYGRVLKRSGGTVQRWLATPTLALLEQLHTEGVHGGFTVLRSEVSQGSTITRKWAVNLRQMLYDATSPEMSGAIKQVYTRSVGMLTRPGGVVYRPDWSLQIVSDAQANTWRKLRKAHQRGINAVSVNTDEFTFAGDTPWIPAAIQSLYPEGIQLGTYRHRVVDTEA